MNSLKKLVLIREFYEYADGYKGRTKTAFCTMIRDLLKGYDLAEPRNTVLRWVKACMEELVHEEMGSGTQVDQDDFKAAVELFKNRLEAVDAEIKQSRKSKEARLQSFLRPLGCKKQWYLSLMTRLFQALIQKVQHHEGHRLL